MSSETGRVDTGVPKEWTFQIEKKYHEFHQRLIKLKEAGDRPKIKRLS